MISDKYLLILAAVAAVMLVLTMVLYITCGGDESGFKRGMPLLQGLGTKDVWSIVIEGEDGPVTLGKREDGNFGVRSMFNYPADTETLNELLVNSINIRCGEEVTRSTEYHADLGVSDDREESPEAVKVTFYDEEEEELAGYIVGHDADVGSGVFIRRSDEDTVYRTEEDLSVDTSADDYVDMDILEFEDEEVDFVDVNHVDGSYSMARNNRDEIVLKNIPANKKGKKSDYSGVFSALSSFSFEDVLPVDELKNMKVDWKATYVCGLNSGVTYYAQVGQFEEKYLARIAAGGADNRNLQKYRLTTQEKLMSDEDFVLKAIETADKFNAKHSNWLYEISEWKAGYLSKPFKDLIEDRKKKKGQKKKDEEKPEQEEDK